MNGKPAGDSSNGITVKQVLAMAGTVLLIMVVGLVVMLLQGKDQASASLQTLRIEMQEFKSWKDNWKPQVDTFMLTTQALDKNVAVVTMQLTELAKSTRDLLDAIRTQQSDLEKLSSMQIQFRTTLERIELQGKRR